MNFNRQDSNVDVGSSGQPTEGSGWTVKQELVLLKELDTFFVNLSRQLEIGFVVLEARIDLMIKIV